MEVINSGAMQSDPMQPVRDWMALRNRGERITAVGASDSHDVARYIVGQGRTYIACRDDDPARLDVDAACRALKAGRALVSLGLLARMSVDDRFGVGDLATRLGETVRVAVDVLGPSWAAADRVELFANGVKVREARIDPSPGAVKARVAWTLPRPPPRRLAGGDRLRAGRDGPLLGHRTALSADLARLDPARRSGSPTRSTWTATATAPGRARGPTPRRRSPGSALAPEALLPALAACDEAIAAQAAGLCRAAGRDVRDAEFARLLAAAPEPVRRGFAAFAATLPAPPAGSTPGR